MKSEKWLVLSVILLSISIAFSGFFVGKSILALEKSNKQISTEQKSSGDILSLSEATVFLKISEIKLKSLVGSSKSMDEIGIPYYNIDNNVMFSKTALSKWIVAVSERKFQYE